jgi:Uncharacterised protein family (UPF0093)
MLLVKSLHLIFMVTWFAGLFYLPRLFVYHAQASDRVSIERFKVMERKLFWGITTPGGVPGRGRLAARQARAGYGSCCISRLVRQADARFPRRAQREEPCLVPLVQ